MKEDKSICNNPSPENPFKINDTVTVNSRYNRDFSNKYFEYGTLHKVYDVRAMTLLLISKNSGKIWLHVDYVE